MMKIEIYETEDLPESDQASINDVPTFESEFIEPIKINVKEALKRFEGKYLDSKSIDFSDITNKKLGYGLLEDPKVTLIKKIESIRSRIKHLAEEVKITKNKLEESDDCNLYEDVGAVRKQLSYLSSVRPQAEQPDAQLGNLMSKLNEVTSKRQVTSKNLVAAETDIITYQLFQWPDDSSVSHRKLATVEAKIKRCEDVIGDSSKLTLLRNENEIKSIMELLNLVVSKATILNLNQLMKLEPRLTYIQQRVAMVLNSKTDSDLTDKVDKATSLHQKLMPSLILFDKIENIFDNLHLLDGHHKSAFEYHETLIHLQARQSNILRVLQSNQDLLKQAELQMADEISMFENSVASIKMQEQK